MVQLWWLLPAVLITNCLSQEYADSSSVHIDDSENDRVPENCMCVPFYACKNGKIVEDRYEVRRSVNIRKRQVNEEQDTPYCLSYFDVCCQPSQSSRTIRSVHKCGNSNPNGVNDRISNMTNNPGKAKFGEWPWQVAILGGDSRVICGGALIDDRHIITTAVCFDRTNKQTQGNMIIRLGEWDLESTDESLPSEDYSIEKVMTHPAFDRKNYQNDIAVIRLNRKVSFKPHIDTICIPRGSDNFTGMVCTATGWGMDPTDLSESSIMKEVNLPVIDNETCQSIFRRTSIGDRDDLFKNALCAGGRQGEDTCYGDSGSPLVCFRPDHSYAVAGLSSWGLGCGRAGIPGGYVDVKRYIDWITSKIQEPI